MNSKEEKDIKLYKKYGLTLLEGIAVFIVMLLVITGIVISVYDMITQAVTWRRVLRLLIYIFLCWYALMGYKKPHGNLLKYLFLAFDVFVLATVTHILEYNGADMPLNTIIRVVLYCIVAVLIPYMAGRLNRIKENTFLGIIVLVCLLGTALLNNLFSSSTGSLFSSMHCTVLGLAVLAAYVVRYRQHRESGLEDK